VTTRPDNPPADPPADPRADPSGGADRVAAVLLAAGGGSRFAAPDHKLLALLRGRPVLAWACEHVLDAGLDEVFVVTGAVDFAELLTDLVARRPDPPDPTLRVLHNSDWQDGIATSLRVGIAAAADAAHGAVVVGLADQPFVRPSAWATVARHPAPIAVATYAGQRGNPVKLSAAMWPLLPRSGDEGARALMRWRPDLVEEVPCDGDPFDIDTVEDLTRWS